MEIQDPRLRSLLRQADKVAEAGKRAAAEQLYRQIIEEAPETAGAWFGLGQVSSDPNEQTKAYEKALALEPEHADAARALAELRGEAPPDWAKETEQPVEDLVETPTETAVSAPLPEPPAADRHLHSVGSSEEEEDYELVCYRHPNRPTSLRCYNCGKPICSSCAIKTPVGYSCPDCIREKEEIFFNATTLDYLVAPAVGLVLSLIAGWLVARFSLGGGFFLIIIMLFVGGIAGRLIGQLSKRAIGRRRGRYLPHIMVVMVFLGTAVWLLPYILAIILGGFSGFFAILGPGIYLFSAASAVFSYMK